MISSNYLAGYIKACFDCDSLSAYKSILEVANNEKELLPRLIRVGANCPGHTPLFYGQLYNLWVKNHQPRLKPSPTETRAYLLTDFTADPLVNTVRLFCASRGVNADVEVAAFDSVETEILDKNSRLYSGKFDLCIVILSEHWLEKYVGVGFISSEEDYKRIFDLLVNLITSLKKEFNGYIVFSNFYDRAFPAVCSSINSNIGCGRSVLVDRLNSVLANANDSRFLVCDIRTAVHLAGGAGALGRKNYFFAKLAFDLKGVVQISREIASTIADGYGQTHRMAALDLDNTLWGGEIAELGLHEIVSGYDSPDANGYRCIQEYFLGLKNTGTLLAAVSRNAPLVIEKLNENKNLRIKKSDFSSVQLNFVPKSELISRVISDINFGGEYILFIDDSDYEISEVLLNHEYIDVLRAGASPDLTLGSMAESRFFNRAVVRIEDMEKSKSFESLVMQREIRKSCKTNDEFLSQININLSFSRYSEVNKSRVLQLINKSNQFNLTSRRHNDSDVNKLLTDEAEVWVFSYNDDFGSQGVVSVLILCRYENVIEIDTWVMSCRVLNRTVEDAIFSWINQRYHGKLLRGVYIPTSKNELVKDHYKKLGFDYSKELGSWEWLCRIHDIRHHVKSFREE